MKLLSTTLACRIKKCFRYFLIHPIGQLNKIRQFAKDVWCITQSGLFDSAWYVRRYRDVADAGINPLIHYIRRGAYEGRDPNPLFSVNWYLRQNPSLADASDNPLAHYFRYGTRLKLDPSAYFDIEWYVSEYGDLGNLGMHPLRHYLKIGAAKGNRPTPNKSALRRWIEENNKENLPKLLMIDQRYPRPDQDSGSIDCINYIGIFQKLGYQVFFASEQEYNLEPEIYQSLEKRSVLCLNPADYLTIEEFIETEIEGFSAVFLSRVFSGGRFYEFIRKRNPRIKIIFNPVDLHSLREKREAKINKDPEILKLALETAKRELYLASECDATIVVSQYERKYLEKENLGANVVHFPLMRDCPGRGNNFSDRSGICFIGSYRHSPNTDAILYFLDDIWPLIHAKLSVCKFYIIGSYLPAEIARRKAPNVEILGHVHDLRTWLERVRLSVAPLRYGAGAKGKVATSLANGLPCVATDIAIEGMELDKYRHIAIENSPEAFADRVVQLYQDKDTWTILSDEGWRFCTDKFSYASGRERMTQLFNTLGLQVV